MKLLRKLFGPNQNEVWEQLSNEIGAQFIKGGFFKGASRVEARIKHWDVILDTFTVSTGKSTVVYTRLSAPFINQDGFQFTIYRKGFFSSVGKLLGMQDVEVGGPKYKKLEPLLGLPGYLNPQIIESGDPEFDKDFVIKATDEAKVRDIFKQIKIRDLLHSQPTIHLQIKSDDGWFKRRKKIDIDNLYFQEAGVITDIERLKQLFELFTEILQALQALGTASKEKVKR